MTTTDERMPVTIMGRTIGTASGWDGEDQTLGFYDFEPSETTAAELSKTNSLQIDFTTGKITAWNEDGCLEWEILDGIAVLAKLPLDEVA
jgi:hypothetical protein